MASRRRGPEQIPRRALLPSGHPQSVVSQMMAFAQATRERAAAVAKPRPHRKRSVPGAAERRTAKELLRRAEAGDASAAAVLVDALIYAGQPEAAESLAFALQGRAYSELGSDKNYPWGFERGAPLPSELQRDNLQWAIDLARRSLFPVRRLPCMPNARALRDLALSVAPSDPRRARAVLAAIRRRIGRVCDGERAILSLSRDDIEQSLVEINALLGGRGVAVDFAGGDAPGDPWDRFDYVDLGDMSKPTVLFHWDTDRFHVVSADEMFTRLNRRLQRRQGREQ